MPCHRGARQQQAAPEAPDEGRRRRPEADARPRAVLPDVLGRAGRARLAQDVQRRQQHDERLVGVGMRQLGGDAARVEAAFAITRGGEGRDGHRQPEVGFHLAAVVRQPHRHSAMSSPRRDLDFPGDAVLGHEPSCVERLVPLYSRQEGRQQQRAAEARLEGQEAVRTAARGCCWHAGVGHGCSGRRGELRAERMSHRARVACDQKFEVELHETLCECSI
eukprot:scaffold80092_cov72-Phaeocystis_antarctica.AAC.3